MTIKSEAWVERKGEVTFNSMRNDLIFILTWDTGINEHTKKRLQKAIDALTHYLGLNTNKMVLKLRE